MMIGRSPSRASITAAMPSRTAQRRESTVPDAAARAAVVRRRLLKWYGVHQRRLPWRASKGQTPNPYHVLVSEAMLQQTQVATVIPYFHRFIAALPTVGDLADADEQTVLRLWQGLGYYRRARNLHAAARVIQREHASRVPDTVEALLNLPGVGRYTAGAIASIAYGRPAPILDGNVARVLARLFLIERPVDAPDTRKTLWQLAEALVPDRRAGDFNQALMELGALVCTKANPSCKTCPLAGECDALKADRVSAVPVPAIRKAPIPVHHHILAIERAGRFLFQQRPAAGLWSNMWQLPTVESWNGKVNGTTINAWIAEHLGLVTAPPTSSGVFTHQTTHRTISFYLWRTQVASGRLRTGAGQWRSLNALDDLPLPNPQRKAIKVLTVQTTSRSGPAH
jgi:A/G-specific adenine glycosylase